MNERLEDRFELQSRIGGGSGGEVYRVRELATGQIKALKVMDARNAAIPGAEIRFRNECTGLEHEYLIRVDQVLRLSGNLCLVMELIDGDSLERIINEHWNLTVEEKIRFMARVCRGLEFAHRSGRVHRDIKPSNLLRVRRTGAPKIIDFGVAKMLGAHGPTIHGTVVGTYAYMSPEQIQGLEVSVRSDIFSAAVVLYEFLTGICPFDSAGQYQTEEKIVRGPSPRLPVNLAGIPDPLHKVLDRALQKKPAHRYSSAGEMADALEACLEPPRPQPEAPTVTPPPPQPAQQQPAAPKQPAPKPFMWKPAPAAPTRARRQPSAWQPSSARQPQPAPKPRPDPPPQPQSSSAGAALGMLVTALVLGAIGWGITAYLTTPRTPSELYQDGMKKQKAGDLTAAFDQLNRSCSGQYAAACTEAGLMKANGQGGPADSARAAQLFQRGCDLNHSWSCTHLGYAYQNGLGVETNHLKATALYLKGCKGGDQQGCTLLAQLGASKAPVKKLGKIKPGEKADPGLTLPNLHWDQFPWSNSK